MRFYVVTRTALFIALGAIFKASLAFLPNVELVTFWVYVNTMLYGFAYGAFIGVASNMLADIFFTGFGPWTIFVSLAFALSAIFFHVWFGKRISFLPFFILAIVAIFFLVFLAYPNGDSLSCVVGWGFFFLSMSAFVFSLGHRIHSGLTDIQKKTASLILGLLFGIFILFMVEDLISGKMALILLSIWVLLLFLWKYCSRFIFLLAGRILGERVNFIASMGNAISRNKSVAWAAIFSTIIWDVFTVVTTNVMLFGQPLALALYAQYGIIPPTFYPFGLVHILNNMLIITLLGERVIGLIEKAEKTYL